MRYGVHVRINASGRLTKYSRNHRANRRQLILVSGYAQQCHYRIRGPCQKPQPDDGQNNGGQLQFGLVFVLVRLDFFGGRHHLQNVHVTIGDDGERNGPGEQEENKHKNACIRRLVQIVKAARGQITFGHIFTVSNVQGWNDGEKKAVQPNDDNHNAGTPSRG